MDQPEFKHSVQNYHRVTRCTVVGRLPRRRKAKMTTSRNPANLHKTARRQSGRWMDSSKKLSSPYKSQIRKHECE